MSGPKKDRKRALAVLGGAIARQRYQLFRDGLGRIKEAIAGGWYLEAIILIESFLADRLESRLSFLVGKDRSFANLGPLLRQLRNWEIDPTMLELLPKIDEWRTQRNRASHEMLKIAEGDKRTWEDRMAESKIVAKRGSALTRLTGDSVARLRPRSRRQVRSA